MSSLDRTLDSDEILNSGNVLALDPGKAIALDSGKALSLDSGKALALARAFVLDSNSEWVVVATGVTISELSEDGNILTASLHDEIDTNTILFSTSFHKDQEIVRQQATVVTWTSADGSDVALSFENEEGLDHFWSTEYIPHEDDAGRPETPMSEDEPLTEHSSMMVLPTEVEFSTVPDIDESLERIANVAPDIRRSICIAIMENNYIGKLLDLFRVAEDLESRECLFRLYSIFKHLVLLNNPAILRELLSEQNVFHVAGVFEYDPTYPDTRPGYRQFLLDRSRFKQVLDLRNPQLVELIHQTFRIQYLKDVVLPRILDEEAFGSLLFMLRCNFAEIIEIYEGTEDFLPKLLPLFKSERSDDCISTLKFMKEFLTVAKASSNGRNLKLYQ